MKLFKRSLLGLSAIVAVAIVFYSCDKISIPVNVPLTSDAIAFTIPAASAGDDSVDFTYTVNIDTLITNNTSLSLSNIKSVKIDSVNITDPSATNGNSLYNISSASVFVKSDVNTDSTQIAVLSSNTPDPNYPNDVQPSLVIPVNNTINLDSYIAQTNTATTFTFKLRCHLSQPLTSLACYATVHFIVQASL